MFELILFLIIGCIVLGIVLALLCVVVAILSGIADLLLGAVLATGRLFKWGFKRLFLV